MTSTCSKSPSATPKRSTQMRTTPRSSSTRHKQKSHVTTSTTAAPSASSLNNLMITNGYNDVDAVHNSVDQWYTKVSQLASQHKRLMKEEESHVSVNPRTGRKQWNRLSHTSNGT